MFKIFECKNEYETITIFNFDRNGVNDYLQHLYNDMVKNGIFDISLYLTFTEIMYFYNHTQNYNYIIFDDVLIMYDNMEIYTYYIDGDFTIDCTDIYNYNGYNFNGNGKYQKLHYIDNDTIHIEKYDIKKSLYNVLNEYNIKSDFDFIPYN